MKRARRSHHDWFGTRTYGTWRSLRTRCMNPNGKLWKYYGGRGITVCERWNRFPNFLEDMGPAPTEKHTIDRIDNNGNYEPSNCRWATMKQQQEHMRPRSSTVWLTFRGETHSATEWAKITGIKRKTIYERLKKGWDIESTLTLEPWMGMSPGGWRQMEPEESE